MARLPNEYQEVEYLESSGAQWIDTGYYPSSETRAVLEAELLREKFYLFGAGGASDSSTWNIKSWGVNGTTNVYSNYNSDTLTSVFTATLVGKHIVVDANKNELYIDGDLIIAHSVQSFQSLYTMYLFQFNINGGRIIAANSCFRAFSFKVFDNDVLIRNFIPCYRKSDNKPGMYDLVNGVFYTNANTSATTDFIVGPDVIYEYIFTSGKSCFAKTKLPAAYQEVEYLKSTGTQWIDTVIYPNLDYSFEIKAIKQVNRSLIGTQNLCITGSSAGTSYAYIGNSNGSSYGFMLPVSDKSAAHVWSIMHRTASVDGVSTSTSTYSLIPDAQICVFARSRNDVSGAYDAGSHTVYYVKIWDDNDTLVSYLIPCYRKSDRKPGMYDTVTGTFYVNQGTGEFLMGDEVVLLPIKSSVFFTQSVLPNEYQEVEYLTFFSDCSADTLYLPLFKFRDVNKIEYDFSSNSDSQKDILLGSNYVQTGWIGWGGTIGSMSYYVAGLSNFSVSPDINNSQKGDGVRKVVIISYDNTNISTTYSEAGIGGYNPTDGCKEKKIYKIRTYLNNVINHHFVPCYRKSDSVAGMYDLVNNQFYTNAGTGSFVVGPNVYGKLHATSNSKFYSEA